MTEHFVVVFIFKYTHACKRKHRNKTPYSVNKKENATWLWSDDRWNLAMLPPLNA
jgi:hypothetical protein